MPRWSNPKRAYRHGFTIIEMAIIAPIVILTIVAFVTFVINLTGDTAAERTASQLTYNIQDALSRIESDVKMSTLFVEQNDVTLTSPQGLNNDTTVFKNNTTPATLILDTPATTDNPLSSTASYVYMPNSPNACSSANVSQNSVMINNVVYFVSGGTLWRRVLMRSDYASAGCTVPWQQPSCGSISGFCTAKDIKVLENVTSFTVNYYSSAGSDTVLTNATGSGTSDTNRRIALIYADTVKVSITASSTAGGRTISRDGSMRVSRSSKLTCPAGFIAVPGSSTYGTDDFCVMKYEAKCAANSDLTVGLTTPNTGVNTYSNSTTACTSANGESVVSVASGYPIANISQSTASAQSTSTCTGCHLMTEAEWMTIAQNVLSVPSNWSGGSVGSGYVYSGHNDNSPAAQALVADTNDTNGYYLTGNTSPSNQKRTLTLTNGEVIWDLAGNMWEWTSGNTTTVSGNQPGVSTNTGFQWSQWTSVNSNGTLSVSPFPSGTLLSGSSTWNNTNNGIGNLYSYTLDTTVRGMIRGGYWAETANTGLLALNLGNIPTPATPLNNVGFRVTK